MQWEKCPDKEIQWKGQDFFVTVFPHRASVVWKLRDFSQIEHEEGYYLESHKFDFLNATWNLIIYFSSAFRRPLAYFQRVSSTVEIQNVKYKLFFRDKFMKEVHSVQSVREFSQTIPNYVWLGIKSFEWFTCIDARALLLPEDTLTLCLEIGDAEAKEQEDTPTGVECETEFFNSDLKKLLEDLETVYKEAPFTDVTLKVAGEEFPAHKSILSRRSPVFRAMFENDMKENQERVADIRELEAKTARQMLKYIYTGKVEDLEDVSARSLYVAADRYDLKGLKARCQHYLLRHISVDNVYQLALLADLHSDNELETAVRLFIERNHLEVLQSAIWNEYANNKPDFFLKLMATVFLKFPKRESTKE